MNEFQRQFDRDADFAVVQFESDGVIGFVVDVGAGREATADVVDGTAIVVADGEQYEFDVPAGTSETRVNNGVVTVEVSQ